MPLQRTDAELLQWMRTPDFGRRYREWRQTFDEGLAARADVPSVAESEAAVKDMAVALDVPDDVAGGLFKREIKPGFVDFLARPRQR